MDRIDTNMTLSEFPKIEKPESTIIIDGIFGSGLSRPVKGKYAELIRAINESGCQVVSIDIPSGMFCDATHEDGEVVKADFTISFQSPKLSFFLPENIRFLQSWEIADIGLDSKFINKMECDHELIGKESIVTLLKTRPTFFS